MMASWVIQNCGIDVTKQSFHALDFEPRDTDENRVLPQQHGVPAAEVAMTFFVAGVPMCIL